MTKAKAENFRIFLASPGDIRDERQAARQAIYRVGAEAAIRDRFNRQVIAWDQSGAKLDAYYVKLYGLTRDELRYIPDPADIMGEDYPSETLRVLKKNEIRNFGEYRTQRLVLETWDGLVAGQLQ